MGQNTYDMHRFTHGSGNRSRWCRCPLARWQWGRRGSVRLQKNKNKINIRKNEANAPYHTNLGGTIQRRIRSIRMGGNRQSFQPLLKTRRGHVFLVHQTMTTAGFHLPKVHLLKRRLILIGGIGPRLGYPFDSSVRKGTLGPGFLGMVTLTWGIMISTRKSMSRGGEDWGDRRGF